ncbi:MAG: nuoH [Betaproteobacteria bacterium]|nr:nuoH [Betaproteobacteria bacterium]
MSNETYCATWSLCKPLDSWGLAHLGAIWDPLSHLVISLALIVCVVLPLLGSVAYSILWERKLIGWMQVRIGPNRVGPLGLFQPIADGLKLLLKEVLIPTGANRGLFILAPIMVIMPAMAAWAVMPFGPQAVLANINAGLLFVMAITSLEVYGIIIAGWASNSKYAFIGAIRASAQMVSYELAMGFSLLIVLLVSGSLNMNDIVLGQTKGLFANNSVGKLCEIWFGVHVSQLDWLYLNFLSWNWLPLLPIFVIYLVSGVAETNRHPFDVVEGESEIVAGHMVEYSGMAFALFFLAEYANMILISMLTATFFFGGWDAPFSFLSFIPGWIWLIGKAFFFLSFFIWIRASFPRYRYDQIMRLGWKVFIPLTIVWLAVIGLWVVSPWSIWN